MPQGLEDVGRESVEVCVQHFAARPAEARVVSAYAARRQHGAAHRVVACSPLTEPLAGLDGDNAVRNDQQGCGGASPGGSWQAADER